MSPRQIDLVQQTFAEIRPIAPAAAELFYKRLFALDPSLRSLFRTNSMSVQGQMLMSMIGAAVGNLRDLEKLAPVVRELGARHVGYGVKEEHYATVGHALLWTLEQGLGADFTLEVRNAWAAAYALLADVMRAGARDSAAVAA